MRVTVNQSAFQAQILHRTRQFLRGSSRVLHGQSGKAAQTIGMACNLLRQEIIVLM